MFAGSTYGNSAFCHNCINVRIITIVVKYISDDIELNVIAETMVNKKKKKEEFVFSNFLYLFVVLIVLKSIFQTTISFSYKCNNL